MAFEWTDEAFAMIADKYDEALEAMVAAHRENNPSDESTDDELKGKYTTEALAEAVEGTDATVAGARMKLAKAGRYFKKPEGAKKTAKTASTSKGGGRTSKAEAQAALISVLTGKLGIDEASLEMDQFEKLTGKFAQHLADVLNTVNVA
ncbi:hypothetical protein [Proteus phage 2]|nr:hypothetical protein [Proteus phage 2]QOC54958.1 hypothetical protein [Proteus phage M4H10_20]